MALKFLFNALSGKFDLVDSGGGAVTNPLSEHDRQRARNHHN